MTWTQKRKKKHDSSPFQLNFHFLLLNSWGFMKKKAQFGNYSFISKDYKGFSYLERTKKILNTIFPTLFTFLHTKTHNPVFK